MTARVCGKLLRAKAVLKIDTGTHVSANIRNTGIARGTWYLVPWGINHFEVHHAMTYRQYLFLEVHKISQIQSQQCTLRGKKYTGTLYVFASL